MSYAAADADGQEWKSPAQIHTAAISAKAIKCFSAGQKNKWKKSPGF